MQCQVPVADNDWTSPYLELALDARGQAIEKFLLNFSCKSYKKLKYKQLKFNQSGTEFIVCLWLWLRCLKMIDAEG